jgi:hypothetical protein
MDKLDWLADHLIELRKIAESEKLPFLVYLLEMACVEAESCARPDKGVIRRSEHSFRLTDLI